jgi:uncharacterized repeat protein (TIGR04138 family)
MEQEPELIRELRRLVRERGRWPLDAYLFVYQAIDAAQRQVGEKRHVTPRELLEGFRCLAVDTFGPLSLMVLRSWRLTESRDVGQMVFDMVERGLMTKTDEDRLEDFAGAWALEETFAPDRLASGLGLSGRLPSYRPVVRPLPAASRVGAAQG